MTTLIVNYSYINQNIV